MSIGGVRYKIKSHRRDAESAEKEKVFFLAVEKTVRKKLPFFGNLTKKNWMNHRYKDPHGKSKERNIFASSAPLR
jgi:hypothetical protein